MNDFNKQVYEIVERIPRGKVVSYGLIARLVGNPRASRQVGRAMHNCPEGLPWQRVVMADGSITGGLFADMRRSLLEEEGIDINAEGRVDMKVYWWDGIDIP